jgi:hypothetical protein
MGAESPSCVVGSSKKYPANGGHLSSSTLRANGLAVLMSTLRARQLSDSLEESADYGFNEACQLDTTTTDGMRLASSGMAMRNR